MDRRNRKHAGFTLIEILAVIAIIGIIGSVAVVKYMSYMKGAAIDSTELKIRKIAEVLEAHYFQNKKYPETLEELVEPEEEGKEAVLRKSALYDPWDNPFQYSVSEGQEHPFELISFGPDGQEGSEDDINYWEMEERDPEEEEAK